MPKTLCSSLPSHWCAWSFIKDLTIKEETITANHLIAVDNMLQIRTIKTRERRHGKAFSSASYYDLTHRSCKRAWNDSNRNQALDVSTKISYEHFRPGNFPNPCAKLFYPREASATHFVDLPIYSLNFVCPERSVIFSLFVNCARTQ